MYAVIVLYWLVGWAYRESLGVVLGYISIFFSHDKQACIFCFVQSLRFNSCTYYTFHQTLFFIFPILILNSIGG